jgi:cytidylate kinase
MKRITIAIDGPAGAGKSTIAKRLAGELDLQYLDTGAMYRALAHQVHQNAVATDNEEAVVAVLHGMKMEFGHGDPVRVFVDGQEITDAIRTPVIAELASALSAYGDVRKEMVARQQEIISEGGYVLEGRDATTVIAPNAELKIFMTASLETRAIRRTRQFEEQGKEEDFNRVRSDIENRDHRDITRTESPLAVAKDAKLLETGGLTIEQVMAQIKVWVDELT